MKIFRNKRLLLVIAIVAVLLGSAFLMLKNTIFISKNTVRILDYGFSICTMDTPSTSCGSYEVKAQSMNGKKATYKVDGFDNRKSERYDRITSHITNAKEQNTTVTLKTNDKGYIVDVEW